MKTETLEIIKPVGMIYAIHAFFPFIRTGIFSVQQDTHTVADESSVSL